MSDELNLDHRQLGAHRLSKGLWFFVFWGLMGAAMVVFSILRGLHKPISDGFLSTTSIAIFSVGIAFLVMSTISFRAFCIKRRELLSEAGSYGQPRGEG